MTDDKPLRHIRRERQDPPPHRTLRHSRWSVADNFRQNLRQHDGHFHVEQSTHFVRKISGPGKSRGCAHIVGSDEKWLTCSESQQVYQGTELRREGPSIISGCAWRLSESP